MDITTLLAIIGDLEVERRVHAQEIERLTAALAATQEIAELAVVREPAE